MPVVGIGHIQKAVRAPGQPGIEGPEQPDTIRGRPEFQQAGDILPVHADEPVISPPRRVKVPMRVNLLGL